MFDLVVRGGRLVRSSGVMRADVAGDLAVEDGRIVEIGPDVGAGREELDATGLTIFPGLIDVHVHFNDPGRADWEGGGTGSRALAAGGGTMFLDMPLNSTPCTVDEVSFDLKREALAASSIADFALWGGLVPGNCGALAELADRGVIGFKAFLSDSGLAEFPRADDLTLYEGMRQAAALGLPVAVHAESEEITKGLAMRLLQAGRNDIAAFLESRPVVAEVEAITRAGLLARQTGCKLHVVHISSGAGVAAALEARALGTDISLETCPHYLFFTEEDLLRMGAVAKCAPPLRSGPVQSSLWDAVLGEEIDIIGSDHSPCPPELKERSNFFDVWGGIAGVQSTLPVLVDAGYHRRGMTLERIAMVTAANGARRFGLWSRGALEVGNFADMAVVDLEAAEEPALLHRHGVSPYAGYRLRGSVCKTIRRGEVIFSDGAVVAESNGEFVYPNRDRNA